MRRAAAATLIALLSAGCGGRGSAVPGACADVVDAVATADADGSFTVAVTIRSGDTGWDKYADRWEVIGPGGTVLGSRALAHPHVDEQPFTRSQSGIVVPGGVDVVTVRARDSVEGFCGAELEVEVRR